VWVMDTVPLRRAARRLRRLQNQFAGAARKSAKLSFHFLNIVVSHLSGHMPIRQELEISLLA